MKFNLLLLLFLSCSLICPAQKADEKAVSAAQQRIFKKQILVDDLDYRSKDVPFAAVRVFVRTKLAEWLWKDGKDETGRAEPLTVKAIEEVYAKPDEMTRSFSSRATLFRLLEVNAKETAVKLRTKYNIGSAEDLYNSTSFLNKKAGDNVIAEKVKKALTDTKDLAVIQFYLMNLQERKSPELVPLLSEIVNIQESGRNNFTTASFLWIEDDFNDATVPKDLKIRFYKIVLNRAKTALQITDGGEIHFADLALFKVLPDIAANAPEMMAEASGIKTMLAAKNSPYDREFQESQQRIDESSNRLDALIAEADKTDHKNLKESYLDEAARLAEKEGKFQLAADLTERTIEINDEKSSSEKEFRVSTHDQRLGFIADSALQKNDIISADYATRKIINDLKKADVLRQTANHFLRQKDVAAASNLYDEALKLITKTENNQLKINALLALIPIAAAIDQSRLSEIVSYTAKSVNNLPTLNSEDKPGTENFKNYVTNVLQTNFILHNHGREFDVEEQKRGDVFLRIKLIAKNFASQLIWQC